MVPENKCKYKKLLVTLSEFPLEKPAQRTVEGAMMRNTNLKDSTQFGLCPNSQLL